MKLLKRCLLFLLAFSLIVPTSVLASNSEYDSVEALSELSANSFALLDGFTLKPLLAKNCDLALPMASTTKVMTCIIALENGVLSDVVTIPKEAVGVEGSSVYLTLGERLTLEELLFALILESANDAAVAIALHISGSIEDFACLMNQKAALLGMKGTNYENPHGLPSDGHRSTAIDLCKLLAYCMQNEAFRIISSTKKMNISAPDSGKRFLANHNKLLRFYDYCIAGKTGFTKEAGRCLVTAAEKNGRVLICATLGDPNDWMDHVSLFQYGFDLYEEKKLLSSGEISLSVPVVGGVTDSVTVQNEKNLSISLRTDENVCCSKEIPEFLYASLHKGDIVGYAVYTLDNNVIARVPLIAQCDVLKNKKKLSFWERLIQNFRLWIE